MFVMTDGAAQGITPARAIDTILGDAPAPEPEDEMTPAQMREWIMSSPGLQPGMTDEEGYDAAVREAAKLILLAFEDDPSLLDVPLKDEVDWDAVRAAEAWDRAHEFITRRGLYERLRERGLRKHFSKLGLSGFQFGWAANAARMVAGREEEPNPALMEIGD